MTVNILLYHFNNYYNRKLRVYDDLVDYGTPLIIIPNVQSFTPGDGVSTTHVINHIEQDIDSVDYALVVVNNMIVSRWFVLDGNYTRNGQTVITLYRDTIAEKKANVFNAPMFVEKATLSDDSPFIFNDESISVNQIKTSETLLKDNTNCAWIVGYLARDYAGGEEKTFDAVAIQDATYTSIQEYPFYAYLMNERRLLDHYEIRVRIRYTSTGIDQYIYYRNGDWYIGNTRVSNVPYDFTQAEMEQAVTDINNNASARSINQAFAEVGKTIKVGNEYQNITASQGRDKSYYYNITNDLSWSSRVNQGVASVVSSTHTILNREVVLVASRWIHLWNPVTTVGTFKVTIPSTRYHLSDAPYDMFCIPYGESVHYKNSIGSYQFDCTINKGLALSIAQGLKASLSANIYDVQLLPYCPISGYSVTDGVIDIINSDSRASTNITTGTGTYASTILWCTKSQNSLSLDYSFSVGNKKISNTCDKVRFCSPNYNGVFEMTPAKNNGIEGVTVDYTYMPFNPYIHVAPVFSGLYGSEFGDARGLICQGDFSITTYDDKWADYQLSNKNYLNTFNREIESMELNQDIARKTGLAQAIVGTVTGAGAGAFTGTMVGGNWGAAIGGVVGGAASAVGGAVDYRNMIRQQEDSIDFKKDLFGYQLDNIKALPNSIAKITSITANNKLFPFVEYYTCTEAEKKALAEKIRFNGMSVGVIGKISDYEGNEWSYEDISDRGYIKGKLIDTDDLDCDYHMANAIAEELNKGIYLKGDN